MKRWEGGNLKRLRQCYYLVGVCCLPGLGQELYFAQLSHQISPQIQVKNSNCHILCEDLRNITKPRLSFPQANKCPFFCTLSIWRRLRVEGRIWFTFNLRIKLCWRRVKRGRTAQPMRRFQVRRLSLAGWFIGLPPANEWVSLGLPPSVLKHEHTLPISDLTEDTRTGVRPFQRPPFRSK